jgi:hypothetical protein
MHTPPAQLAAAFGKLHGMPQPPQSVVVVVGVSHPLVNIAVQCAKPALQFAIAHVPVAQVSMEFAYDPHATPQTPQLVSVVSGVSQPLLVMPSQSPYPALQVAMPHAPDAHVAVAFASGPHGTPQPPQLLVVLSAVSQPFVTGPVQWAKPALHVATAHIPVAHVEVAFGSVQPAPHALQLLSVFSGVSQSWPSALQCPKPGLQLDTAHIPVAQVPAPFMTVQAVPHAPQFATVFSGDSQPLLAMPSQLPKPGLQLRTAHVPVAQVDAAFAKEQVVPQPPQLASVFSCVSQSWPTPVQWP